MVLNENQKKLLREGVEKHPILYDVKAEHSQKKLQDSRDAAWEKIRKKVGVAESECREQWTHIRNMFAAARRERAKKIVEGVTLKIKHIEIFLNFLNPHVSCNEILYNEILKLYDEEITIKALEKKMKKKEKKLKKKANQVENGESKVDNEGEKGQKKEKKVANKEYKEMKVENGESKVDNEGKKGQKKEKKVANKENKLDNIEIKVENGESKVDNEGKKGQKKNNKVVNNEKKIGNKEMKVENGDKKVDNDASTSTGSSTSLASLNSNSSTPRGKGSIKGEMDSPRRDAGISEASNLTIEVLEDLTEKAQRNLEEAANILDELQNAKDLPTIREQAKVIMKYSKILKYLGELPK